MSAAVHLAKALALTVRFVFVGAASLIRALWLLLVKAVGMYPSIALGGFLLAVFLSWLLTFMTMRARAVGAEAQRDSIAWQYTQFKERHGYQ